MISDEEKGRMIEEWLSERSNNTDEENGLGNAEKQAQLAKIINIVLIIAIVVASILTPFARMV